MYASFLSFRKPCIWSFWLCHLFMNRFWRFLISLDLGLWLLGLVCAVMAAGSFLLKGEAAVAINAMPLFAWLLAAPASVSWWLWLTIALLALLVVNTLFCSFDTLRQKLRRAALLPTLAPQLIHAGFLLIVAAHLVSSVWGFKQTLQLAPGMLANLPNGQLFMLGRVAQMLSPQGMPVGASGELFIDPNQPDRRVIISPNNPWFSGGYGVYIKHAELQPQPWALLEIHREPGAGMALAGSLLFSIGAALLLWLRSKSKENKYDGG